MAKLLLIDIPTLRPGTNEIGDIVAIMEDSHVFSPAEIGGFRVLDIPGVKAADVKSEFNKLIPNDLSESEQAEIPKYEFKIKDESAETLAGKVACKSAAISAIRADR